MAKFKLPSFKHIRPPDLLPDRRASNWLLITSFMVVAFHSLRLPLPVLLMAIVFLAWRFFIDNRGWRTPGRILRLCLVAVMLAVVLQHYGTVVGRDAGSALLVVLLCLKLIEMRTRREYLLTIFLQLFLILVAFLHNQSLYTGLIAAILGFATTATLVQVSQGNVVRLRALTHVAGGMLWKAIPLMLVFYLLFPRLQGSLWGLPQDAFSGSTGMSDKVSPGSVSELIKNEEPAFRADFGSRRPNNSDLYWRTLVLSETDGRSWTRMPNDWPVSRLSYESIGSPIQYSVLYEPSGKKWLPVLDMPSDVPRTVKLYGGSTLESYTRIRQTRELEFVSQLRYNTGPISQRQLRQNLELPASVSDRVQQLVDGWLATTKQPEQLVKTALNYFRNEPFRYTLRPPRLGSRPTEEFLFDTRAGFCEHYASAFGILMRVAGIPTRMVIGYQGGEWNWSGDYLLVRQSDAHAWNEVWIEGKGWIRVDPTAAIAPERIELGIDILRELEDSAYPIGSLSESEILRLTAPNWLKLQARNMRQQIDALGTAWDKWVMGYGPEEQRNFMRALGFQSFSWTNQILLMVAASLLIILLATMTLLRPKRKTDPVARQYNRFCSKLAKTGITREPWEGPLDFAHRIITLRPDLASTVNDITLSYVDLRYADNSNMTLKLFSKKIKNFNARAR